MRICWFWTYFVLEVDFPALKIHRVRKIFQDSIPRSDISGTPLWQSAPPVWFNNPPPLVVDGEKTAGNGVEHDQRWNDFSGETENRQTLEPNVQSHVASAARKSVEKKCACVRTVKCYLYTHHRVHDSCHCLDAKSARKRNLRSAQDYKWIPDSGELDNNWDLVARRQFPQARLSVTLALSLLSLVRPFFVLPPLSVHSCHWRSQDEEPHHVGLSVHVEDEDDEKYVFQLKLTHFKCCWTEGSNVLFCLVRKCNGNMKCTLALEYLLMIYDLVVDTVVLLVCWNRRLM